MRGTIDDDWLGRPCLIEQTALRYPPISGSLTASITVDQVREAPHIAKADRITDAGESELHLAAPVAALGICLCSVTSAVHRGRRLIDDIGCAAPVGQVW